MDPTLHTFIAVGSLLVAFYSGKFFTKDSVPNVVEKLLDRLEKDGYIETRWVDGEKDIIKISEIRAKVLRDAYKK